MLTLHTVSGSGSIEDKLCTSSSAGPPTTPTVPATTPAVSSLTLTAIGRHEHIILSIAQVSPLKYSRSNLQMRHIVLQNKTQILRISYMKLYSMHWET